MTHYIDIHVLPDPEFEATTLMNALYAKLHRVLGQCAEGEVGVSFPQHRKTLGSQLRLHGSKEKLSVLMSEKWLKGLNDYTNVSEIRVTPDNVKYRTVFRVQCKSAHNKRSRSIRKGWLSEEEARVKIKDKGQKLLTQPFAQLKSLSSQNPFRLYIEHGELKEESTIGRFSTYGLSKTATIPWFDA